jgi:hypothetical protein
LVRVPFGCSVGHDGYSEKPDDEMNGGSRVERPVPSTARNHERARVVVSEFASSPSDTAAFFHVTSVGSLYR